MSGSTVKSHDWGKVFLQDRQFRTSCLSRIICQFWKQFVSYIATQVSLRPEADQASGNRAASSSSSGLVLQRSNKLAPKRLGQEFLNVDMKDAYDPLADLPFWLQDFTDNVEDTEVYAPHTFLRPQIRNVQRKW